MHFYRLDIEETRIKLAVVLLKKEGLLEVCRSMMRRIRMVEGVWIEVD